MKLQFPALILVICLLSSCKENADSTLTYSQLKCNGFNDPAGTGNKPEFSWLLSSQLKGQNQSAYEIIVSSDKSVTDKFIGDYWSSGKINSGNTSWIPYAGKELLSDKDYFWRVRIWDGNDTPMPWSETAKFHTGLFERKDWEGAKWIGYEEIPDSLLLVPGVHGNGNNLGEVAKKRTAVPLFRKEFDASKKIAKAFVFVTGLGHYELYINGVKTGDHYLSPGWTDYRKTVLYNSFDVTKNLKKGKNVIGAIAGNGFYNINRERYRKLVIAQGAPKLILKLKVEYADGSSDILISDESWKSSPSPITFSSIYGGEDYDAQLEQSGWDKPGFDDNLWKSALAVKEPEGLLKPESDFPVKIEETISVNKITQKGDSCFIYDFGQNASAIIKIKVKGQKGQVVKFTPGELLGEDSLVTQKATGGPYYFSYTLKGSGEEIWLPRFTYYGFRYVQVTGAVPAKSKNPANLPVLSDIQMLHTRNSSPVTGSFSCSNELFNSVYDLINWSIKSNLASVATDCPHREKLGWLEQTHLMGNSIRYIYDIHNLYNKIIDDMIEAQLENGLVPDIAPEYVPFAGGFRDSPEWGSACVILPWNMYEWYGDTSAIRKAYPMMKNYLAYLEKMAVENILSHGLGDWYDLGPKSPGEAQLTPKSLTATSIYFYDVKLLGKMAGILNLETDAEYYNNLAEKIRISFNKKFLDPATKVYSTGSQTAYSMPLYFGMADDSCKTEIILNLVKSINESNKALTAGDIGYRYLLRVLEQEGLSQLIFDMNYRSDVPGYGYQLSKGATALTESWAALKYVSNNHMMLGHLMEWFFSGIGGIRQFPGSAGYQKFLIQPEIIGDLTSAEASINTNNGTVSTSWHIENEYLTLKVIIPVNSTAIVRIPSIESGKTTADDKPLAEASFVKLLNVENGMVFAEVLSGEYTFRTPYKKQ
jgi:alpha-L-rhamnosidase